MLILKRIIFAGAGYQSEPEVCGRLHPDYASIASLQARLCPGDDAGRLSFLASNCLSSTCLTHSKPDCVQAMMRVSCLVSSFLSSICCYGMGCCEHNFFLKIKILNFV